LNGLSIQKVYASVGLDFVGYTVPKALAAKVIVPKGYIGHTVNTFPQYERTKNASNMTMVSDI
jgi:hypothetical protein